MRIRIGSELLFKSLFAKFYHIIQCLMVLHRCQNRLIGSIHFIEYSLNIPGVSVKSLVQFVKTLLRQAAASIMKMLLGEPEIRILIYGFKVQWHTTLIERFRWRIEQFLHHTPFASGKDKRCIPASLDISPK